MQNRRILVVDDERIVAQDIIEVVTHMGCEVVGTALSGEEAINKAGTLRPDLILMDITLQGQMDGVEAASIIRRDFDIPCMFLTAYSDKSYLERAKLTQPAGYMVKPFEEAGLRSTIEIALYKVDLERALRESNEWLQTTLMSIGDGVIATTSAGLVEFMNPQAQAMTGWTKGEAKGRWLEDIFPIRNEFTSNPVVNPALEAIQERRVCKLGEGTLLRRKDGVEIPIDNSGAPILNPRGEVIGAVLVFRDITDQRKAQRAVQQHQLKLEEEVAARTGELQQINHQLRQEVEERHRAERAANYRAERESLLAGLSALFLKTRQSEVDAAVESALSRIGQFLHVDRCYLMASDPTGELLICTHEWTREGVVSNKNGDGNLVQASLPLAPSTVPGLGSLVVSHRHDQGNPAFHPELAEARGARSVLMVQTADGTQDSRFLGVDCVDALRRWQEVDASLLGMAAEPLLSCLNRRKIEGDKQTLQGQLTQAQKMEAVGKLSSGIAHDFNNMLLPIIGYADMVIGRLPPGDPNIFELTEIRQVAQRAATLTRQLLTFSRKQVITKTVFNVNEALAGMRSMLRRIIGEDNQMRWHLAEDLLCIKADIGQIEQIVMNLCVNARDAMAPNGGTIDITTMNLRAEAHPLPLIGGKTAREGEFVCLAVADTGTGIPAEVAQRIFEPFFTTKGQEGTGLGLSVIYGILQEHGGGIDLRSEVGKGTVFHVYLPAVRQQPPPVIAATATPTPAAAVAAEPERKYIGHGQSVLLVEDEESVNRLVRTALTQNGYRVTSADCYTDAIRKFEQHRGEFDMIFSDAVLPDGNGVDLISVFRNHNPNLRVLLSSGYTDRHHLMDMAKLQQMSFLSKPYTLPKLFQTVAEVMEDQTQHMLV